MKKSINKDLIKFLWILLDVILVVAMFLTSHFEYIMFLMFSIIILINGIVGFYWFKIFNLSWSSYQIVEVKGSIIGDTSYTIKRLWYFKNLEFYDYIFERDTKHYMSFETLSEAQEQIDWILEQRKKRTQKYNYKVVSQTKLVKTSCPRCKTEAKFHVHQDHSFTCLNCIATFDVNGNFLFEGKTP